VAETNDFNLVILLLQL